ncbi:alpha/beta hydrolase [Streptomyces sp. NPDC085995]|uniref:alpha/beta hydrolase n=1 Tax=Streptomyces sp. NPDC085995 TaxID=3154861 RepID=UPI00342C8ABE
MSLDPEIETLLKQLAVQDAPAPETLTVADNRAAGRAFAALAGDTPPIAGVRDTAVAGDGRDIPVRVYRPIADRDAGPLPVTLFLHGGGWVFGDLDTQDHIARTVAARSGTVVVSVDYRLAPEHRFPAAVEDAYTVLTRVAENAAGFGGDAERIAVFGESAGGNLAAVLAQESVRRGGPRISVQVLAYPVLDRFDDSPSMYENMTGPVLSRSYLEWFWGAYLATPDQGADPRVSPGRAEDLTGLPPAVIATAEHDPLRDQGERYARRLADAGVPVEHLPVEGAVHGFLSFTGSVRLARDVLDRLADAVGRAFA